MSRLRCRESEAREQKSEVGAQKSEIRSRESGIGKSEWLSIAKGATQAFPCIFMNHQRSPTNKKRQSLRNSGGLPSKACPMN